ncbi:hypothetical protein ACROYT_G036194 [Oculina patagonica]
MSKIEYSDLLFEISEKLDGNKLPRLIFMCREEIAKGSEENIRDVLALFKELEKHNSLGIDRLDTLKEILTRMKKRPLLKKVEEFEIKRKAQSVGIVSSLKQAAASIKGAVKLVCNVRTIAGGLVVIPSAMALLRLHSCSSLEEFMEIFNKVVLPLYSKLVEISEGSLCFTVQAETSSALKELWDIYNSGILQNRLQEFLVTEEIKELASGEDVEVSVFIDEQEYKEAYLDLMLLQNHVSDIKEEERLGVRRRRNSDSFLCFKPNEDGVTLMKLKHAENKLNFDSQRLQALEEENKKLKAEIAEAKNALRRLGWQEEESAQETEKLERPGISRRRHSDSDLYCKARDEGIRESEGKPEISVGDEARYLDSEKYAFVQSYLQNIREETQSMTAETSDSGIRTHGAPSDIGMEDISDDIYTLCLKDLSKKVTNEMLTRLQVDEVARKDFYQSFGIKDSNKLRMVGLVKYFTDTPVKLMKEVFEALQLYDLVDLLEKPRKSHPARSLRIALPLHEIENLRKTAERPTTYHSGAAVLVIDARVWSSDTKGIDSFFKDLNSKSEVTTIKCRKLEELLNLQFRRTFIDKLNSQTLQGEIQKIEPDVYKEIKVAKRAASSVIDRWIHNQGNFSLFAVFVLSDYKLYLPGDTVQTMWTTLLEDVLGKLVTGIPDKVKFVVQKDSGPMWTKNKLSETLMVTTGTVNEEFLTLLLEIFNKRWRTLDLISMMEELKRSFGGLFNLRLRIPDMVKITDRLSLLPRFKKEDPIPITHST